MKQIKEIKLGLFIFIRSFSFIIFNGVLSVFINQIKDGHQPDEMPNLLIIGMCAVIGFVSILKEYELKEEINKIGRIKMYEDKIIVKKVFNSWQMRMVLVFGVLV